MSNVVSRSDHRVHSDEIEIDVRKLVNDLYLQRHFIIKIAILFSVIGLSLSILRVPQYQANALLQVEGKSQGGSSLLSSVSQFMPSLSSPADTPGVQMALIQSRFILEPVIQSLGLDVKLKPYHFPGTNWLFSTNSDVAVSNVILPVEYNNKKLRLVLDKDDHFELFNPQNELLLEGPLHTVVKNHDGSITLEVDAANSPHNKKFVLTKLSTSKTLKKVTKSLKITDLGLITGEAQKTGILQLTYTDPDPQLSVSVLNKIAEITKQKSVEKKINDSIKTLDFLNKKLPEMKSSLDIAEKKMNDYRAKSGRLDVKIQTQFFLMNLNNIEKQLQTLQLNKVDMLQLYTPDHPFILQLNGKINGLTKERERLQRRLAMLPASDQVALNLMRDVKIQNDLYLMLLKKIEQTEVEKGAATSDVRILSLASIPEEPLSLSKLVTVISSLIIGFFAGCFIVLIRKMFSSYKINTPQWVERHLNLVNLAIVPFSQQQKINSAAEQSRVTLLAQENSRDPAIEALRSLRTNLQLLLCSAHNNIVGIIGISPGIGKSFIAANFAYLFAQAGRRVLLIDGDLRKGNLHNYFNLFQTPGLTELIDNTATVKTALHKTKQENLMFLPTGRLPKNPAELIMSPRFKDTILDLAPQFDLVIIDTSPILAVTDGVLIGTFTGTNLLVVGSNRHQPQEIESTLQRLNAANVKIHGSIYNYLSNEYKMQNHISYEND